MSAMCSCTNYTQCVDSKNIPAHSKEYEMNYAIRNPKGIAVFLTTTQHTYKMCNTW